MALEPELLMDGSALPSGGMLQTKGSYNTAVAVIKPRSLTEVQRRLMEEAALMGDAGFYGWGAGKDAIEGPSEALAFAAARCWGNTAIEYAPVVEGPDAYFFTAYFVDLETGFTLGRPFRQSKKWTVYGKLDDERKADVRFQIGATKAGRNVILKALPSWLIDKAMEQCKAGVRDGLEKLIAQKGIAAAQDAALKALAKHGVKEEDVLRKFSVAARSALDLDRLVIIKGDLAALQRGDVRASEIYPPPEASNSGAKASDLLGEDAKAKGAEGASAPANGAPEPLEEPKAQEPATPAGPATSLFDDAPAASAIKARLSERQIADCRETADHNGVSMDDVEGYLGAKLSELEGDDPVAVEQRVVDAIGVLKRKAGKGAK